MSLVNNLKQRKTQLRNLSKKYRKQLTPEVKNRLDLELQRRFLQSDIYKNCRVLFLFISKEIEVDTSLILQTALQDKKPVAVPKCCGNSPAMHFYFINQYTDLQKGMYDLLEPNPGCCEMVTDVSQGVCLVPGLCFDREGYRLGFGKGYYDRFLMEFKGITVSLCYSKCVEDTLPRGYYDKPVNILITEKYRIDTRADR